MKGIHDTYSGHEASQDGDHIQWEAYGCPFCTWKILCNVALLIGTSQHVAYARPCGREDQRWYVHSLAAAEEAERDQEIIWSIWLSALLWGELVCLPLATFPKFQLLVSGASLRILQD